MFKIVASAVYAVSLNFAVSIPIKIPAIITIAPIRAKAPEIIHSDLFIKIPLKICENNNLLIIF